MEYAKLIGWEDSKPTPTGVMNVHIRDISMAENFKLEAIFKKTNETDDPDELTDLVRQQCELVLCDAEGKPFHPDEIVKLTSRYSKVREILYGKIKETLDNGEDDEEKKPQEPTPNPNS